MIIGPTTLGMLAAGLLAMSAAPASGQNYPNKSVRMVTAEVGAAGDLVARSVAPLLSESFGQPVIVENRGGSGVIPIQTAAKAAPDGYTLLVFGSTLWLLPFIQDVSYSVSDFAPVTLAVTTPLLVVVHPSVPAKSVKELVALAKARPGTLNYASGIAGSATHLPAELFKSMAGVDIVRVAYKGGGPALTAILGGEVQVMFATSSGAGPHVGSGKLRALAVTSAQPSALFPGLPTVAASGLPGYDAASTMCVFAPARTPPAIVGRLNQELVRILNKPDVKERFIRAGSEVVAGSPEQLAAAIKADMSRMGKVIKDAGIRAE